MLKIPATMDLLFVDKHRLSILADLGDLPRDFHTSWKVVLSLAPQFEVARTPVEAPSLIKQIRMAIEYLNQKELLLRRRPRAMLDVRENDFRGRHFVLETMKARKIIFPKQATQCVPGLRDLAVWISDPLAEDMERNRDRWDYGGMFLYLTEAHWENGELETVWSGCSAFHAIMNHINDSTQLINRNIEGEEQRGEGSCAHPIERFERIGGVASEERRILSLYRMRYVTDEQVYVFRGKRHRVSDMLGYPLFIAAS